MQGNPQVIDGLNAALTIELTAINQYFCQAKMCQNWGFLILGKKHYEESIGEMFHGRLRSATQYENEIRGNLRQSQCLFDELGQAIFHSNAGAQLVGQGRTLFCHALDCPANLTQSVILFAISGFRTQAHKGRAEQALHFRIGVPNQSLANLVNDGAN